MDEILRNTHKQEYIKYLKARDYYFDKARRIDRWHIWPTILIPALLAGVSYIPGVKDLGNIADIRDYVVGLLTIVSFSLINFLFKPKIEKYLGISNFIREQYDLKVFNLPENSFAFNPDYLNNIQEYLKNARHYPHKDKYELWYQEIFCDNHTRNVLCSQMDNVCYTYHLYKSYKNSLCKFLIIIFIVLVCLAIWQKEPRAVALIMLASSNIILYVVENILSAKLLSGRNRQLIDNVINFGESSMALKHCNNLSLRMIQDIILANRDIGLFVPKFIRNRHLKDDSPFYKDLDKIKSIYFDDKTTSFPSSADEIDIWNIEETRTVTLKEIQGRLLDMLQKVTRVFDKHDITYTLDGGTLIGEERDKGFLFWDDDIDIAIKSSDIEKAQKVIKEELKDQYDVQDCKSDSFYSPRLSNFRIRDKKSKITEKDSALYDRYQFRGLFIDVYAYSPILYCRTIDFLYRAIFIHPLNRIIKRTEDKYALFCNPPETEKKEKRKQKRILKRFKWLKSKYICFAEWYLNHARCEKYFVYSPYYIDKLSRPGPYIRKEDLYGEKRTGLFENMELPVPSCPDRVLTASYGQWNKSPFLSKEDLINGETQKEKKCSCLRIFRKTSDAEITVEEREKTWFSKKLFRSSVMKHISQVSLDIL